MKKTKNRPDPVTISCRVPRNTVNRMKRYTAYEGINQSGIIQRALERELWRFEKELTRKLRAQKEIELSEDDSDK